MNLSEWFSYQLRAGGDGFIWAVEQIPPERLMLMPPPRFGLWPAGRQAYHLLNYDTNLALPEMRRWLDGKPPSGRHYAAWRNEDYEWDETCDTIWGPVTLKWVVSKTFQHTAEHSCTVMQMALFWDSVAARQ